MNITCPTCGHADRHSPLMGCLTLDCDCIAELPMVKTITEARAERDEAMAKAERGTDDDWAAEAESAVRTLAQTDPARGALDPAPTFTPDDVWELLEARKVRAPREPRALGPVLQRLARARVIRPYAFTMSRRRHGAPVRVYMAGPNL